MLFTGIGLICVFHFLIGVIVHCSAENSNSNEFQMCSHRVRTADANGRAIADLTSYWSLSLVAAFTHNCMYQNIIYLPRLDQTDFLKSDLRATGIFEFVQAEESKKKSFILSCNSNRLTCLNLQESGTETIYHFERF